MLLGLDAASLARRTGSGVPRRWHAVDPGFHGVPDAPV